MMSVTEMRDGMFGPVPARAGAGATPPFGGGAFAAVIAAQGGDAADLPVVPGPDPEEAPPLGGAHADAPEPAPVRSAPLTGVRPGGAQGEDAYLAVDETGIPVAAAAGDGTVPPAVILPPFDAPPRIGITTEATAASGQPSPPGAEDAGTLSPAPVLVLPAAPAPHDSATVPAQPGTSLPTAATLLPLAAALPVSALAASAAVPLSRHIPVSDPPSVLVSANRVAASPAAGPKVASASASFTLAPAAGALPPQIAASSALVAAIGGVSDPIGLADRAFAAPDSRATAPPVGFLAPPGPPGSAAPDIARQIALRVAQVAESGPGGARGTVEISLSPEELGRVRLRLHPSETGLNVTITADRPETLDLMRRNIDMLAREFLEIGYQGAEFDFAQDSPGAEADPDAPGPAPAPASGPAPPEPAAPPQTAWLVLGERLDIRL